MYGKPYSFKMMSLVFILSICFVKCSAMSQSELEEFSNFLEATSRLDINLKSKGPEDDYDEDAPISDNAWEESGKFEGDLILNERQRRLLIADVAEGLSRNGLQDTTKRWPNNEVIYYIQLEHFTSGQVQAIQAGIDDLAQVSCVRFTPYKRGDRDAVVIQGSRRGCFSQVGYQGGYQVLNLSGRHPVGRGCFRHGTVVHELLHSLGFYHMQSSPDRDDYIDVVWQNIIKPARHNFRKYNSFAVNDFGVGYDYESVLHYSRRAFSSNGQDTLVPKQLGAEIGQRIGLSQKDIQKLNKMYCDDDFNDSNNADSDSTPKKPAVTKNKSKNKPFDGHGIGYHQGKAVVIKLEPTVELLRLPTLSTLHTFDYFSNAQQVVPATLTDTGGGEREMKYLSTKSRNINEYYKPTTTTIKSLVPIKTYNIKTATISNTDKTAVQLIDNEKQNQNRAIDQKGLNIASDEFNSDVEVAFGKVSNLVKPQYDIQSVKGSGKYFSPEINDYYKDPDEVLPSEYKTYTEYRHGRQNEENKKSPSFLPQSHTSVKHNYRRIYPLEEFRYDPYESNEPESKSFFKHYLTEASNNNNPEAGDYTSLLNTGVPVYSDDRTKYKYEHTPNNNYYDKHSYTS